MKLQLKHAQSSLQALEDEISRMEKCLISLKVERLNIALPSLSYVRLTFIFQVPTTAISKIVSSERVPLLKFLSCKASGEVAILFLDTLERKWEPLAEAESASRNDESLSEISLILHRETDQLYSTLPVTGSTNRQEDLGHTR